MEETQIQYFEEEKYFSLKSSHLFKFQIELVWNIISHPAKLLIALGEWVDKVEYKEHDNKYELLFEKQMKFKVDSQLRFRWKSIFECMLDIKQVIDTDFHKKILFDSYAFYPFHIKYQIIYSLYWNSVEENTILIHEVVCNVNNKMFQNDQEQNRKERYIMFKKIEEMLGNEINALYQEEMMILDISIDELWYIVTDWRKFQKYVPQICLETSYNGDPLKIGTEMKIIKNGKNKTGFTNLRVIESMYNKIGNKENEFFEKFFINNYDKIQNCFTENISGLYIPNSNLNKSLEDKMNFSERSVNNINNSKKQYEHEYPSKNNNYFNLEKKKNLDEESYNVCKSKITKYEENDSISEYKYILECYEGVPKCPPQLLIFKFIKLCENKSLLVFRHEFKQPVKQDLIRNIGIEKKKILNDFRKSINEQKQNK